MIKNLIKVFLDHKPLNGSAYNYSIIYNKILYYVLYYSIIFKIFRKYINITNKIYIIHVNS